MTQTQEQILLLSLLLSLSETLCIRQHSASNEGFCGGIANSTIDQNSKLNCEYQISTVSMFLYILIGIMYEQSWECVHVSDCQVGERKECCDRAFLTPSIFRTVQNSIKTEDVLCIHSGLFFKTRKVWGEVQTEDVLSEGLPSCTAFHGLPLEHTLPTGFCHHAYA